MVWQSPPTSTPQSDPSLRIPLSKPFHGFKDYNWLRGVNKPLQQRDYPSNLFTQVSHTLKLLQLRWINEGYNETHSMSRYSKMKNKKRFNVCFPQVLRLKISRVLFVLACWRSWKWVGFEFYSLSSKTSRYSHFGRNRITGYGHPEFHLMLSLQPQIWIYEHPDFRFVTSGFPLTLSSLLPNNRISVCQDLEFRF